MAKKEGGMLTNLYLDVSESARSCSHDRAAVTQGCKVNRAVAQAAIA